MELFMYVIAIVAVIVVVEWDCSRQRRKRIARDHKTFTIKDFRVSLNGEPLELNADLTMRFHGEKPVDPVITDFSKEKDEPPVP